MGGRWGCNRQKTYVVLSRDGGKGKQYKYLGSFHFSVSTAFTQSAVLDHCNAREHWPFRPVPHTLVRVMF